MKLDALIWAKAEDGQRHLCPMDDLADANFVRPEEIEKCVDDDSRLETRANVPSNDPEGRLKFTKSLSLN